MTPLYERGNGILLTIIIIVANIAMVFIVGHISATYENPSWLGYTLMVVIAIMFTALIIIGIPFLWSYHKTLVDTATEMRNHIDDTKNRHITMTRFEKEILISKDTLENGLCCMTHHIEIYNHHKTKSYDNYKYSMESSEGITEQPNFEFWLNDNEQPTKIPKNKFTPYKKEPHAPSEPETVREVIYGCDIDIPLGIQGNKSGKLKIYETDCPYFSKLKNCDAEGVIVESIGIMIYYPTETLKLVVKLDDNVKGYKLKSGGICPADSGSGTMDFRVIDRSNQRIEPYEHKLVSWGATPSFDKNGRNITWEVHSPKVGYRYRLPFCLVREDVIDLYKIESESLVEVTEDKLEHEN